MILKLTPSQVPEFWEAIKYAAARADSIPEKQAKLYLTRLLIALLDSTAQCFIRYTKEKELVAICITRIALDEITGEKILHISSLYGFKKAIDPEWIENFKVLERFAKANDCVRITGYTTNPRVMELGAMFGLSQRYICYTKEVN